MAEHIELDIIGQRIQLARRSSDKLKGLNVGERLSFDYYDGAFKGTDMLFVKPKGSNPTPRKCDITAKRLFEIFNLPVVYILAPGPGYERQRLLEKDVHFVMSDKYANLPMLVAMEKVSTRRMPSKLTPVAQYLILYHLQIESIEGKNTKTIAAMMPYSYESVSLGLTCLSDLGLCEKVVIDSRSKTINFKKSQIELWEMAKQYMINPVERRIYCDGLESDRIYPICGVNALSHYSMLNPDPEEWIMMTVSDFRKVVRENKIINPNEFDGNIIIEAWKYPPVHRKGEGAKWVDKLSLALSLNGDEDPRVEDAVEQMIKSIQW